MQQVAIDRHLKTHTPALTPPSPSPRLDQYGAWRRTRSRPKRPLSTIVIPSNVKTHLVVDAQEFLTSEEWYSDRGIPYRRGYLLYGSPGSGKTSFVYSLAVRT